MRTHWAAVAHNDARLRIPDGAGSQPPLHREYCSCTPILYLLGARLFVRHPTRDGPKHWPAWLALDLLFLAIPKLKFPHHALEKQHTHAASLRASCSHRALVAAHGLEPRAVEKAASLSLHVVSSRYVPFPCSRAETCLRTRCRLEAEGFLPLLAAQRLTRRGFPSNAKLAHQSNNWPHQSSPQSVLSTPKAVSGSAMAAVPVLPSPQLGTSNTDPASEQADPARWISS